jgi:hypothetical protein
MKVEAISTTVNAVYGEMEFSKVIATTKEGSDWQKRYTVWKVENDLLADLKGYLEELGEEGGAEDFDEDGNLKEFHEDERVSDFLKQFVRVSRIPNTYKVTVDFIVEAETEEEAEEKVNDSIRGGNYESYDITDTEEEN